MIRQSTGIHISRYAMRVRCVDILSFLVLVSMIPVYPIDALLPSHFKTTIVMVGLFFLLMRYLILHCVPTPYVLIWGIFMVWLCFCNWRNSLSFLYAVSNPMKVIVFILMNKFYLDKCDKTFLRMTRHYMTVLLIINYAIQIFNQDMFGYTAAQNYENFIVSDNYLGWYYVPYIALCVILDFIEKNEIRILTYFEIGICIASIVRAWVAKTIVALVLIILYLLFVYHKEIANFFHPKLLWISYIVINVGTVFFGMQRLVSASLYDLFGKDVTLSSRTIIWTSAIQNIKKSLLFGHGVTQGGELFINQGLGGTLVPAHNFFLEIAVQSGIIGLILYVAMMFIAFATGRQKYKRDLRYQQHCYEYLFIYFIIFIMFIMAILSNPIYIPFFYLPLILLISFDSLVDMHVKYTGKNLVQADRLCGRKAI